LLEVFTFIVALILLVLPIVDWTAVHVIRQAAKQAPNNIAIKERLFTAGVLALASSLNGFLAMIRLLDLHPGSQVAILILSASLILGSLPNIYWLSLYYRNSLRK
jgi:hypothetical protein